MKTIDTVICWILAAVFVLAGLDKLLHYDGFVNALSNYVLLPRGLAPFLALPLILLEAGIGFGLLWRGSRAVAALAAAGLMLVFTVAVIVNYLYGDRGVCGCWFSFTLAQGTGMHIVSNLLMAAMAGSVAGSEWGQGAGRARVTQEGSDEPRPSAVTASES